MVGPSLKAMEPKEILSLPGLTMETYHSNETLLTILSHGAVHKLLSM